MLLLAAACQMPGAAPPAPAGRHRDGSPGHTAITGAPDEASRADGPSVADRAPDTGPFFYHGRDYGSEATAGPLDVFFNKGFAIAQWEGRGRNIFSYPYDWTALRRSLERPGPLARAAGGWKEVLRWQAVPFATEGWNRAQWVPNYFGHIMEGGVAYRRLREWNEAHGVPLPSVTAGLVTYGSALVNEAYELPVGNPSTVDGTIGSVVDLYIFDPLGILLFQQDFVARFFSRGLHGALWPTQASLVVNGGLLLNNGETFIFKPPMPFTDRARFFVRAGLGVEGGISFHRGDGTDLTFSVGEQSHQRWLDPVTQLEYASFSWCAGLWLDRDNTLLAGFTWDQGTDRRLALNIFPGFARVAGAAVGGWFVLDAAGRPFVGISTSRTLGAGLGIGF